MGARGPAPLPANVHILKGNPSKIPVNQLRDVVQPKVEIPDPPKHLTKEAKAEWKRIATELLKLGLVSQIDRAALAAYCDAWAEYVRCEVKITELNKADPKGEAGLIGYTPSGYQQMSVWVQIRNRASERMLKFLQQFGMSPSSRGHLVATPQVQADMWGNDPEPGNDSPPTNPADRYFRRAG